MGKVAVSLFTLFGFYCLALMAPAAHAGPERADLSTGVALPFAGDAVALNPSALAGPRALKLLDASVEFGGRGSASPSLTYSSSGGSVGWGVGVRDATGTPAALGAVGFGTGGLQLGVGASSAFGEFSPELSLGLGYGRGSGLQLAAVVYGIDSGLERLAAGLGYQASGFQLELDLLRSSGSYSASIAAGFSPTREISLLLGDSISSSGAGELFAGINAWIGRSTALYFLYHGLASPYAIGLRASF
ncbi:MAG: hypothetical protein NDJ89_12875 [Oligoflexia bacterium]|nr:hypothetical protein [Oligoflexia bacterium]